MGSVSEIQKINSWLSSYYTQYNTSPPENIEGRIHPIQFSHSIIRINATGRAYRGKKLFLQTIFALGCVVLIVYPMLDTNNYLPILLAIGSFVLADYMCYSQVEDKATKLMMNCIIQENESFADVGIRFQWNLYSHNLFVMYSPESEEQQQQQQQPSFQINVQPLPSFKTLHKAYADQILSEQTPLTSKPNETEDEVDAANHEYEHQEEGKSSRFILESAGKAIL